MARSDYRRNDFWYQITAAEITNSNGTLSNANLNHDAIVVTDI